jgi:serine/threonine-protein kinase
VGDRLGRYQLEALLGEGAVGSVFRAVHVDLGRAVAVKVVNPELQDRSDILRRFFNEARAVNRIRHPNIVDITDIHEGGAEPPYLVMELLEGHSLTREIRSRAPLAPARAVAIADQMCDALAAVHAVEIVHRDLKTDNVFLVGEGDAPQVKLLDFGVSKFLAADEAALTRPGELMGTPQIMAPEQIRGQRVDARTDVYAVGITLFEMLTGAHPFETLDLVDLLNRQMREPPPHPSSRLSPEQAEELPPALDELVVRCLAKDPDQRIPDMPTLRDGLERALRGESAPAPVAPTAGARRWRYAAAGIAAALAAGLAAWAAWPSPPTARAPSTRSASPIPSPRRTHAGAGIRLASEPTKAAVYRLADGRFLGRTPLQVHLAPGEKVLLRLPGYRDQPVALETRGDTPQTVRLISARPAARRHAADRPAPRRIAPRRAAPHRTAPRRTAPRRTAPRRVEPGTPNRRRASPGMPPRRPGRDPALVNPFDEP